jgi:predicted HTH domain antitoxin
MSLVIPDEVLEAIEMSEPELLREIAILLFKEKKLSLGRASYLAGMNLLEFRRELASRRIAVSYDISEFKEDLKTLEAMDSE